MEKVYAFTDEYGAFGWEIDNPSVSTHFCGTSLSLFRKGDWAGVYICIARNFQN